MRRSVLLCGIALAVSLPLHAQRVEQAGQAWLSRTTEPAAANVNGMWYDEDWGHLALIQAPGAGTIVGEGDEWRVTGVVGGKEVRLLFHDRAGKVRYSAVLEVKADDTLSGRYAKELLQGGTGGKKLLLKRTSPTVVQSPAEGPAATIVIFRPSAFGARALSPRVAIDDRTLAWVGNARFFSVRVSPGKHTVASQSESDVVTLDARDGRVYYVKVWAPGTVEAASEEEWSEIGPSLKPVEPEKVLVESMVRLEPITRK